MATPVDSANLILKLYDLRREETMRKGRNFVFGFDPKTADEYLSTMMGPNGGHLRMVVSYWEMAATFVNQGAIDATMFDETNGEHILVFAKVEPILSDLRAKMGAPGLLANLEKVCLSAPGGLERVRATGARIRGMIAAQAAAGN